jgi:hypothetical protein
MHSCGNRRREPRPGTGVSIHAAPALFPAGGPMTIDRVGVSTGHQGMPSFERAREDR